MLSTAEDLEYLRRSKDMIKTKSLVDRAVRDFLRNLAGYERGNYSGDHDSNGGCCNAGSGTHPFRIKDAGGWTLPGNMGRHYSAPPGSKMEEQNQIFLLKVGGSAEPQREVQVLPRAESLRHPHGIYEQFITHFGSP